MTPAVGPTFGRIRAKVQAIRRKVPGARVIGIQSAERWTDEPLRQDAELTYAIFQCDSPLAARLALRKPVSDETVKVLVTPLDALELGDDILVRLARRKLYPIDSWEVVQSLFDAAIVDMRLKDLPWMAEALLNLPADDRRAARGGFLDADSAWTMLLNHECGLRPDPADLPTVLRWSLEPGGAERFRRAPEPFRAAATAWLAGKAGPAVELVLHCLTTADRPDLVPIGLAAGVLFHEEAAGKLERSVGKLEERFLKGAVADPDKMRRWHIAATEVVRTLRSPEPTLYRRVLSRADEILHELQAADFARLGDTSPLGFDRRLARLGARLCEALDQRTWDTADELLDERASVRRHDLAVLETRRLERIDMALRLVRRFGELEHHPASEPLSLAAAARDELREGAYFDWARLALRTPDPIPELAAAYERITQRATEIREHRAERFAALLADATSAASLGEDLLPVERILAEVTAPAAAAAPVLTIVLDGMSPAVCRELTADLLAQDWVAVADPRRRATCPGLATLPSVTEFSRTSLLCGRLVRGTAADEKRGFAEHPDLPPLGRGGLPPRLFHKAEIQAPSGRLSTELEDELAAPERRVVGVVLNAVDDRLCKGDQLETDWSSEGIGVFPSLLRAAAAARRLVVLLSDHGHILEAGAELRSPADSGESGARWRDATGALPAEGELEFRGPRVMTPDHRLIAPWSERLRYASKRTGYHGGASPQEMVVPIVVLAMVGQVPKGWSELPFDSPAWWDEPFRPRRTGTQTAPRLKRREPAPPPTLFELERPPTTEAAAGSDVPPWVTALLAGSVFKQQAAPLKRARPSDEVFVLMLAELDRRGGKMTAAALARTLGLALHRVSGLISKAGVVLNVDGYDILRFDNPSETVVLNRDLLLTQFDLT